MACAHNHLSEERKKSPYTFLHRPYKAPSRLEKHADSKTKNNEKVKFAFAGINNSIGIRFTDESTRFFNSEEELDKILQS